MPRLKRIALPLKKIFDYEHLLTPLAVEHLINKSSTGSRTYRIVYVFGIRVAFWSTNKFH